MTELNKSYIPEGTEDKWYEEWVNKGYFTPEINPSGEPYSIVIPPPNVTGSLHMGHALNATLQDVLARWKRMCGFKVLWLPGTDHAGIATQNVVERQLSAEKLTRHQIGRDAFVERVWKWKAEYGGRIIHQLKRLGASCDWSRERFTLDEGLSRAVKEVFVRLYEEGLIYRDNRLINWCPRCRTALSDLEVEHEELDGTLTYIRYPFTPPAPPPLNKVGIVEGGYLIVATTRPETMLGDTAVAVNPSDERYKDLIGKTISLPLTERKIPVIADSAVDMTFGTGAVKVTPAHDFNDEAIAKRQTPSLPSVVVIGKDGIMTSDTGKYAGLDRYECRKQVLRDLKDLQLIEKEEKHMHAIGHCYRCKTIIEPLQTLQWYVDVRSLAVDAIDIVRKGKIKIVPQSWENSYFGWMENIKDWCISRQIWWGHRIPVWYCQEMRNAECRIQNGVIVSRDMSKICPHCGSEELIRDEDVLDTWFSSSLWPFSTLGWPDDTSDLKTFYPTSVLVTAFDILFFWVARMTMMGLKFMGDVPFRDVYIHAIIRDATGQKMSKSKGNVIDPLVIIDKYGTDAFRFTLCAFAAQGRDIKFSEERVEGYRHFVNKLWNAARFIMMNLKTVNSNEIQDTSDNNAPSNPPLFSSANPPECGKIRGGRGSYDDITRYSSLNESLDLAGRWILSRLGATVDEVNSSLEEYRFNDAANSIYQFIWHEFCDWYIELSKSEINNPESGAGVMWCLLHTLETSLRILHPFMPFVTEEIWQHIMQISNFKFQISKKTESIVIAEYPKSLQRDRKAETEMSYVIDAITGIRTIRGELNISPSAGITTRVKTFSEKITDVLKTNLHYIKRLSRSADVEIGSDIKKPLDAASCIKNYMEIYVPLKGVLNTDTEIDRLTKEKNKVEEAIAFIERKLLNEDFLKRAPADVVKKEKARHKELTEKRERIEDNIKKMRELKAANS
ncbi:MAG: valine--tRNA ligase [Nitrospirae bacterium]|nr:valine--tRNA ligase [Nitrospirota bacterium]